MAVDVDRIQSVFAAAAGLSDPAARAALLDRECGDDAALRRRVELLLKAHEDSAGLPNADLAATPILDAGVREGAVVAGRYRLLELIGEGGMGAVWLSEQTDPVKRKVALKLIKPGMDSNAVQARFEAERQALALMDHPNISKILDGGVTEHGRPYFVMEFVKGLPLTEYCDSLRLTVRDRLALFGQICAAVQHAHQKGIIHRDLKPSNILVAEHDGRPVPKVIDFGLAKALGVATTLTERTLHTTFGTVVGTPLYMAPEQVALNAIDVDTRTDVYSLGVILYELLTGTTPLEKKRFKEAAWDEMRRVIREEEPPRPSSRLVDSRDSLPSVSAQRHTEPAALTKLVKGELDWIVMKSLEKDRSRRYESANGLAMDLQRYLADEPVQACPPSSWYQFKKFVRRNRAPMTAATLLLLVLLCGIAATTTAWVWAVRERNDKAKALIAETNAKESEQRARDRALAALRDMTDEIVENQMARGVPLTEDNKEFLRKIIKHFEGFAAITSGDLESRFIRADGYHRVGVMHYHLGEHQEAEAAYADALSLAKPLAAESPTQPEFQRELARLYNNQGNLFRTSGRLAEAEAVFRDASKIQRMLVADFPTRAEFRRELAHSLFNFGQLLMGTGRLKESESAYRDARQHYAQLVVDFPLRPEYRSDLASSHSSLGGLLSATGRLQEAETEYADALALHKQLAVDFPMRAAFRMEMARILTNQGNFLRTLGRLKDAESAFRQALLVKTQLADEFPTRPDIRCELASIQNSLGALFRATGRLNDAESSYVDAIALLRRLVNKFPARHEFREDLAGTCNNLGVLFETTGRRKQAETAYSESLALRKQLAGEFPSIPAFRQELASSYANMGVLLRALGRPKEAEASYLEAIALAKKLTVDFPSRHEFRMNLASCKNNLGYLLRGMGRILEAETAFTESLALFKQLAADLPRQPDLQNRIAMTFSNLAALRLGQRDFKNALALLESAKPHYQAALKANSKHPDYRQCYQNILGALVRVHAGLGDRSAAKLAAEQLRDLGWDPPSNAYGAACFLALCVPIVRKVDEASPEERDKGAAFYGDEAVKMLKLAIARGFPKAAQIETDSDFDSIRSRDDFKKLLVELKAAIK